MINNNPSNTMNNIKAMEDKLFERFSLASGTKTALSPKGSLVVENPIQAAASNAKEMGKDVVNLGKALKDGNSDDHSLGRLNDLGMKLSGLGIATYLFTRRTTPKAKIMEFLGAGVFFTMMNAWQKIFIAAPIKARFGVDINQKYIDSFGRRKELGQDNQYRPSLRTNEERDKLADRMGLPKDMEFRGEYAEEKERRITLQGRTLNMLTAGVATPVMTALICNRIEKYIDKPLNNFMISRAEKNAANLGAKAASKASNPLFAKQSAKTLQEYSNYAGNVDDTFFKNIADAMNPVKMLDENTKLAKKMPNLTDGIALDMKALFASSIDEKAFADDIFDIFSHYAKQKDGKLIMEAVDSNGAKTNLEVPSKELRQAIKNVAAKVKSGEIEYTASGIMDAISNEKGVLKTIETTKAALDDSVIEGIKNEAVRDLRRQGRAKTKADALKLIESGKDKNFNAKIKEAEAVAGKGVVTKTSISAIPAELTGKEGRKTFMSFIEDGKKKFIPSFMEKVKANFKHAKKTAALLSEADGVVKSVDNSFGRQYFEIVDAVFDTVKPSRKELNRLRSDADYAAEYLEKAFKEIASDSEKYSKLIEKINSTPVMSDKQRTKLIKSLVDNASKEFDGASEGFDSSLKSLKKLASKAGFTGDIEKYAAEALPGIDATKNRVLLALDLEMRRNDKALKSQWNAIKKANPSITESFEDALRDARRIIYKSTPGDFANTHYIKGNGAYYEALNDLLFNQPLSKKTKEALKGNKGIIKKLEEMRVSLMAIGSKGTKVGTVSNGVSALVSDYMNTSNFVDANKIIKNEGLRNVFFQTLGETDALKYQKVGKPLRSFVYENASQLFNSKTWMRIFAPVAIALVGVTLGTQVFIGRDKDKHLYMTHNKENQGANNGN